MEPTFTTQAPQETQKDTQALIPLPVGVSEGEQIATQGSLGSSHIRKESEPYPRATQSQAERINVPANGARNDSYARQASQPQATQMQEGTRVRVVQGEMPGEGNRQEDQDSGVQESDSQAAVSETPLEPEDANLEPEQARPQQPGRQRRRGLRRVAPWLGAALSVLGSVAAVGYGAYQVGKDHGKQESYSAYVQEFNNLEQMRQTERQTFIDQENMLKSQISSLSTQAPSTNIPTLVATDNQGKEMLESLRSSIDRHDEGVKKKLDEVITTLEEITTQQLEAKKSLEEQPDQKQESLLPSPESISQLTYSSNGDVLAAGTIAVIKTVSHDNLTITIGAQKLSEERTLGSTPKEGEWKDEYARFGYRNINEAMQAACDVYNETRDSLQNPNVPPTPLSMYNVHLRLEGQPADCKPAK